MKASEAKALADAVSRVDPPGYATLTTQIQGAANSGLYMLEVVTPAIRVQSCLMLDGFTVVDLGNGNSRISWQ